MTKNALVVGGTGPTGPHVLGGLLERGFDVTIFHRGTHEPEGLPDVRHIHGDPHFPESIDASVGIGTYDLVIGAYGRIRYLAESFRGRTGHFISITGPPRYDGFFNPGDRVPRGLTTPVREDSPLIDADAAVSDAARFGQRIVETEEAVFSADPRATILIYPVVYGPRNVVPWEWSILKRVRDGRRSLLLPDDGVVLQSRGAARNLAEFVLLAVDHPDIARGHTYNCADDEQLSVRQFVELVLDELDASMDIVEVPSAIAPHFRDIYVPVPAATSTHCILDTSKARYELGYRDVVTPREAIAETLAWYADNPVDPDTVSPTFVDRFDYQLEDALMSEWGRFRSSMTEWFPQPDSQAVHPMAHPKKQGGLVDERGR